MNVDDLVNNEPVIRLANAITRSHRELVGKEIANLPSTGNQRDLALGLYQLPAVVLSHDGTQNPTFTFANLAAQELFEYSWEQFLSTRSRQSAEPDQQEERAAMLARARKVDYIEDYCGVRISASGKRFQINHATIWNITDQHGNKIGQAAVFDDWQYLID